MRTVFSFLAVAIFVGLTPNSCFALWDVEVVTRERATELGLEVRSKTAGLVHFWVELEFPVANELTHFNEVVLRLGEGDGLVLSAPLREDRSKPGRVVVGFTAERARLDKLTLRVMVPFRDGGLGGTVYEIPVKDFVELK